MLILPYGSWDAKDKHRVSESNLKQHQQQQKREAQQRLYSQI